MAKAKSCEVADDFWLRVETLIPQRARLENQNYNRRAGGGRKPKDPRLVFEAIVYVLLTGCQWKALPAERLESASAIYARFLEWEKAGVFGICGARAWLIPSTLIGTDETLEVVETFDTKDYSNSLIT